MKFNFRVVLPLFITFTLLIVLIFAGKLFVTDKGIDYDVVQGANILFYLISLFVFRMQYLAMFNKNPQVFIRSVMGGMLIKVFACVIAVVAYYFISGAAFNKPAVYASMVIYIIYLVVEVRTIMKLNKTKNG
ncbi:MAG: hypothetical protein IPL84_02580 [Chitinophagaceae bacterium]|nr:hypothetical protein [Chitinophagaceae bacterium]